MKRFFIIFLLFISLPAIAQDETIREVCGVEFGDTYEVARVKLKQYFENRKPASKYAAFSNNHFELAIPELSNIQYKDEYFEGVAFENLYFSFDEDGRFYNASFWIYCDNKNEAKERFEEVADLLRLKYTLYSGSDDKGKFIGYGGGINYKKTEKCAFFLEIYDNTDIVLHITANGF